MAKVIKAAIIAVVVAVLVVLAVNALGAAGFLGSSFTAISVATTAAMTFVGTVVAGGVGMLTNKGISASAANFGTKVSALGGAVPRQLIYGTARVGGTFVKMNTRGTKNAILSSTIVVAGHECDGFDEIYFGETKLTYTTATLNGETVYTVTNTKFENADNDNAFGTDTLARFTFHDGSQTAVDGLANALSQYIYPSTAKFLGCSYFYIELVYDPEKMPNIPKIWFVMRGKNIWDPRANSGNGAVSTTDAQRQNPALQIRDYLTDTTYGLKALASELNDGTAGGGFSSAANLCDQLVTLTVDNQTPPQPLTTERRYTSSGISNFSASGSGLIEALTTACAGNVTYTNGRFNLFGGAGQTAALTITDDKLLAPPRITTQSVSGELFNAVKSIYINKNDNYQASEIGQFTSSPFLAADTPSGEASANFKRVLELRYPFTTSETTAQRLQRISLDHQRQSTTVDLLTSLEFMKAQPNDWIYLTNERLGYTNKIFEIQNMSMTFLENEGQIFAATALSLQEIDASVFDFVYGEYSTPQPNAAQAVIGEVSISPPTIGTPVQITNVEGQTAKINIKAVWANAVDSAIQGTEIQFKKSTEADSLYVTATLAGIGRTTAEIANVTVGVTYNIRVRHFSFDNVYSVYSSVANIAIAQPDTITNPSNLGVTTDKPFNIELSWTNPANTNMRAVDVHYGTNTSYTPSASNRIGTYYGDIGKKKTVLLGRSHGLSYDTNYYFKIIAVNIYGSVPESGGNPVYVTSPAGQMKKVTTVDVDEISANKLSAGIIDADVITVNNLDADKITSGELTLTASAASAVKAGKSSYEDATTAGFFLGFTNPQTGSRVEGIYIGTSTNGMRYDTAGGLVVSGNISATTGSIGGFTISATSIRDAADSFGLSSAVTGGDDIRFYAGATLANKANAPFRVTEAGVITATSGTFSGALSAASGTFTGALSGGTISIGSGNNIFKADSNGIYLGNATFGSAPFRVNPAGALIANNLTANNATLTSATVSGAITATSGSLSSLAVSGALTVGTSGKITGGTSTSFNTGVGFFIGYDSSAYKFSIGDASTNKNLTWDGTDIKIGGAQITASDNPSVVIYDARSGEPPSVTSARVLLTSDTNTFYLKQDYTENLVLTVSYPVGALTSGTVSGEQAAIDSTMATFKFQIYYATTSSPTSFTQFGSDVISSRQTSTGGLISNYLIKTTNLGGGNYKAELQTKTEVRTAYPTLSGLSLGVIDDEYNLIEKTNVSDFPAGEYVFKVVVTVTDGSASSYPATGSPASNLVRSAVVNGFQPVEKSGYGYAVEPFYQPLTTYRDGSASEVVRLSHGNDTLEIAAITRSGHPRLVMVAGRGPSSTPSDTLWSARMVWAKDHETYTVGSNGDYLIGLNDSGSHLFLGKTKSNPLLSELQISNGRVDVIGSLYVDGTEVTGGGGSGTITNVIAGTNLNGGGTSGAVTLSLDSTISGNHTFSNNLIISGNLTVNGTTTTVDTDNLNVKDKNITLNYSTGDSSSTANGAGITIQDAVNSTTNATMLWDTTNDEFDFSHNITAPNLSISNWNTAYGWGNPSGVYLPLAGGTLTGGLSGTTGAFASSLTATSLDVSGLVEFNSLSGTGSVAITNILDEDNMASNSATALATQQSIKAYVLANVNTGSFLPLSGGTLTGGLSGTTASFSSTLSSGATTISGVGTSSSAYALRVYNGAGTPDDLLSIKDDGTIIMGGPSTVQVTKGLGLYVTYNLGVSGLIYKTGGADVEVSGSLRINSGGLKIGTQEVITSGRNLTNIGTINSGAITSSGDSSVGASGNVSMSASSAGQFKVLGAGYTGAIALDANAMHIYHNSSSRTLILGTNETARLTIGGSGGFNFNSNNLTSIGTISSGAITSSSTVTASGGNSTNWNTAYTYSQVGHLPLAGGNMTGALQMSGTTVIDASRNISGANATFNGELISTQGGHNYVRVESSGSGEAMIRYNNTVSGYWYVGLRNATYQNITNTGYHIYSATAGQTVAGWNADRNFYTSNNATIAGTISSAAITSSGVITATGGNSTQWNSAYSWGNPSGTYLPLSGGTMTGDLSIDSPASLRFLSPNNSYQRADNRDDTTTLGRTHWYGVSSSGATSNFRHSWYDGSAYITVTAASGTATFGGILAATGGTSTNWNTAYTYSQVGHLPLAGGTLTGGLTGTTAAFTDTVTMSGSGILNITKGLGVYITNNLSVSGLIYKTGGGDVEVSGNLRINSGGLKIGTTSVIDSSRKFFFDTELYGNSKRIFTTSDTYLRMNQSSEFGAGIWIGTSNLMTSNGYISAGSNGGTTTSRVYIKSGAYNGTNVIAIDGTDGKINSSYLQIGGTTVISSARDISNIGGITAVNLTASGTVSGLNHYVIAGDGNKLGFWGGSTYTIHMASSGSGGRVAGETTSDYNMYFTMSGGTNRGFNFRNGTANVAGIDASGNGGFTGNISTTGTSVGVTQSDGDYLAQLYQTGADGVLELFTGQPTPLSRIKLHSYSTSYINNATGGLGVGITTVGSGQVLNVGGGIGISSTTVIDANRQIFAKTGTQVGEDGTYAGYGVIGFGGITNGYNRVFGNDGTGDGLFLSAATTRGIYFRVNGASADVFGISPSGQFLVAGTPIIDQSRNLTNIGTITPSYLIRSSSQTGHLVGTYNNVGANGTHSNPIYTIGSSYNPAQTTLGDMYGVGYASSAASFISFSGASNWGMYVAADGDARVWLDGTTGNICSKGSVFPEVGYGRTAHHTGYLVGGYNNVGSSGGKSSPIYSIGSAYTASDTSLGNLYGIGYTTYSNALMGATIPGGNDWGMYVAAGGIARVWLDGANGNIGSMGSVYSTGGYRIGTTEVIDSSRNITTPSVYLTDTSTRLHEGSGDALRITTGTGHIDIGSMNGGWIHFQGSLPYYFNQPLHMDNNLYPYSTAGARDLGGTGNVWNHVYAKGYFIDSTEVIDASRNISGVAISGSSLLNVGSSGAGGVARFRGDNYNQVNIAHTGNTTWGLLLTNSNATSNGGYHNSTSGTNMSCAVVNVQNDALHFGTNNTERMTIDHNGNVKITSGTLSMGATTVIDASRNLKNVPVIYNNNSGLQAIDLNNADSLIFDTPDGHSALSLSGGSYDTNYYSNETHYFKGTDVLDIHAIIDTTGIKSFGDYKVGSQTVIDASRNLTNISAVNADDLYINDTIAWYTNSSDRSHQRADARSDGSSNTYSRLHWYGVSHAQATSNFRHAWYDGAAYINVTAESGGVTFTGSLSSGRHTISGSHSSTITTPNINSYGALSAGTAYNYHIMFKQANGTVRGQITNNIYGTQYTTSSDYRLKENVQPLSSSTSRTLALNPCTFEWIDDADNNSIEGFLAHEVAAIVPEAVVGTKDALDADGNPEYQTIDQSKLIPILVKTIQELEARITALESA